jgi:GxxExxY protein
VSDLPDPAVVLASHEGTKARRGRDDGVEQLAAIAVDCALRVHKALGPGLLEKVYEAVLADCLANRGLRVERQKPVDVVFEGRMIRDGFTIDLLVNGQLIIELKSVERLAPIHGKQLLTYLRLARLPLGLLMNFGAETLREGLRRVANNYYGDRDGYEAS